MSNKKNKKVKALRSLLSELRSELNSALKRADRALAEGNKEVVKATCSDVAVMSQTLGTVVVLNVGVGAGEGLFPIEDAETILENMGALNAPEKTYAGAMLSAGIELAKMSESDEETAIEAVIDGRSVKSTLQTSSDEDEDDGEGVIARTKGVVKGHPRKTVAGGVAALMLTVAGIKKATSK